MTISFCRIGGITWRSLRAVSDDLGLAFSDQELQEMMDDARHPEPQLANYSGVWRTLPETKYRCLRQMSLVMGSCRRRSFLPSWEERSSFDYPNGPNGWQNSPCLGQTSPKVSLRTVPSNLRLKKLGCCGRPILSIDWSPKNVINLNLAMFANAWCLLLIPQACQRNITHYTHWNQTESIPSNYFQLLENRSHSSVSSICQTNFCPWKICIRSSQQPLSPPRGLEPVQSFSAPLSYVMTASQWDSAPLAWPWPWSDLWNWFSQHRTSFIAVRAVFLAVQWWRKCQLNLFQRCALLDCYYDGLNLSLSCNPFVVEVVT